jgi:cell division protein FtsB
MERQIDSLRTVLDSLQRQISAALMDLATQERIAREEFGMVRGDKELLYRFAEPSDATERP